jgi:hypothetical protein
MANVYVYSYLVGSINGRRYEAGSLTNPIGKTVTLAYEIIKSVAPTTTVELFDTSKDLSAFQLLWIASDYDLMLELSTDTNATYGERDATVELVGSGIAETYGMPFILGSDASYANYTVNFAAGTVDVIDRIRARNLSSTNTAKVQVLAFN